MSYEVNHFKHSIMQNMKIIEADVSDRTDEEVVEDDITDENICVVPFTQYVADNLDHNIRTLDGTGTFHRLGIISATVYPAGSFDHDGSRIRRCVAMKVTDAIQDRCVPIVTF